jgi:hypothetical protein
MVSASYFLTPALIAIVAGALAKSAETISAARSPDRDHPSIAPADARPPSIRAVANVSSEVA